MCVCVCVLYLKMEMTGLPVTFRGSVEPSLMSMMRFLGVQIQHSAGTATHRPRKPA